MASPAEPGPDGAGTLYLVPVPIGNVGDITLRAVEVLRAASLVAAEDTRKARTLLRGLDVEASLVSYYDFNEQARAGQLLTALRQGRDVALITDAGTPLVNDPGFRVVTAAIEAGLTVRPLPGASAVLTALIGSGLPATPFQYGGFLPRRGPARRAAIGELARLPATLVFFEAPHRLADTLADLRDVLGDRPAALARNLTKSGEEFLRGPLSELASELAARGEVRGEYTVVVAGAAGPDTGAEEELAGRLTRSLLEHGVASRDVREIVQDITGLPRNQVWELVQQARASA